MSKNKILLILASLMILSAPAVYGSDCCDDVMEFSDVKTKFAANLPMWWDKKTPSAQKVEEAHALGFDTIEFWGADREDIDALIAKCEELDMKVAQFSAWGKPITSGKNIDEFEAGIRDAIKLAKRLDCKMMTVTAHRWTDGLTLEEQLENYKQAMLRVAPICEEAGVMIIMEPFNPINHGRNVLNGSKEAVKMCREINSPMIKINWDFYHMQLTEGALILHLQEGIDQVGYLQLGDTPGRFQPGTGELNYKAILKAAYDLGYRGPVGVECKPKGTRKEAVQQLLQNAY